MTKSLKNVNDVSKNLLSKFIHDFSSFNEAMKSRHIK